MCVCEASVGNARRTRFYLYYRSRSPAELMCCHCQDCTLVTFAAWLGLQGLGWCRWTLQRPRRAR